MVANPKPGEHRALQNKRLLIKQKGDKAAKYLQKHNEAQREMDNEKDNKN